MKHWIAAGASAFLMGALLLAPQASAQGKAPKKGASSQPADKAAKATKPKKEEAKQKSNDEWEEDRSPQTLYVNFCSNCHDPGIAGAPKTGNKSEWGTLLKNRGYAGLVDNTIRGAGLMPARGACVGCSEEEIEDVVRFMLEKAKIEPPAKKLKEGK